MKRRLLLSGLLSITVLGITSTAQGDPLSMITWQGQTMGSEYTVKIVGATLATRQVEELQAEVDQRLREINRQMSHYQPDSELSRFNRAPANLPFKISTEFARVMRFALDLNHRSQGAFDPTLGPIINLWGFGEQSQAREVPAADRLQSTLKLTGCQHLRITDHDELIKDLPSLSLNLSAVAKGFGVDEMASVLKRHGLTNLYVSIAGEVKVLGSNSRGTRWQVGISAPVSHWNENDPMAAIASLSNQAISTSGDYQKFFFDAQNRRLCHIIDPRTGWPVQHQLGGVSVVAPDSMTADGLSTTLFVLGPEQGLKFIESWTNAAALFIVRASDGLFRSIPSSHFSSLTSEPLTR